MALCPPHLPKEVGNGGLLPPFTLHGPNPTPAATTPDAGRPAQPLTGCPLTDHGHCSGEHRLGEEGRFTWLCWRWWEQSPRSRDSTWAEGPEHEVPEQPGLKAAGDQGPELPSPCFLTERPWPRCQEP